MSNFKTQGKDHKVVATQAINGEQLQKRYVVVGYFGYEGEDTQIVTRCSTMEEAEKELEKLLKFEEWSSSTFSEDDYGILEEYTFYKYAKGGKHDYYWLVK